LSEYVKYNTASDGHFHCEHVAAEAESSSKLKREPQTETSFQQAKAFEWFSE